MICGIYKITSPSGKVYIGQSVNIKVRFRNYNNLKCEKQIRLLNSLVKYGVKNHIFEIIENCNREKLNERERYWQEYYDCTGKQGLNCSLTGTNNSKQVVSETTRLKMRNSRLGVKWTEKLRATKKERYKKENHKNYGKHLSEDTKRKIAIKSKERMLTNNPVSLKVIDIETLQIYDSITFVSKLNYKGITSQSQLAYILRLKSYNPTKLMLLRNFNDPVKKKEAENRMIKKRKRKVIYNNFTHDFYTTILIASKKLNLSKENIKEILKNSVNFLTYRELYLQTI